jgi:hypothetical protein
MPRPELKWVKQGKQVNAVLRKPNWPYTGHKFEISEKKGIFTLTTDGEVTARGEKSDCKVAAQELVDKEWHAEVAPKVTSLWWYYGPDFHLCHKRKDKILKQSGLSVEDVTPAIARHAAHECYRIVNLVPLSRALKERPKKPREVTVPIPEYHTPQEASDKKVEKAFAQKAPESIQKESKPLTLPAPEKRDGRGCYRIYAPVFKAPFRPENAKWRTLLAWIEKLRDFYQLRGILLSTGSVMTLVDGSFKSKERNEKAVRRVSEILRPEWEEECAQISAMIAEAERTQGTNPTVKVSKGKDRWGYRTGSAAAKVNEVISKEPKTLKRIVFECDVPVARVRAHLGELVRKKKVKKLPDGKYRERKVKK